MQRGKLCFGGKIREKTPLWQGFKGVCTVFITEKGVFYGISCANYGFFNNLGGNITRYKKMNFFKMYADGIRRMTWGRQLWLLVIIKLIIIFAVLRLCLFRPALAGRSDSERSETVGGTLTERAK